MGVLHIPDYYNSFACIGGECADNCCIGWEIDIDDETFDIYKRTDGEFGERLHGSMANDGENSFTLKNNRCPFLNDSNLCDIFINLGEENLCTVCKEYPRFSEYFGTFMEKGLGMSCETAAKLIFGSDKKAEFVTEESDYSSNEDIDTDFLAILLKIRNKIFSILQNRQLSVRKHAAQMLLYAQTVQECVNNNKFNDISKIDICSDIEDTQHSKDDLKACMALCRKLEIMEDKWADVIEKSLEIYDDSFEEKYGEFEYYINEKEYEYEHLLVYLIYRYLLKSVFDYDVLTKVKFAAVSFIIIKQLDISRWLENGKVFTFNDRIKNCVLYSKEVEHCQDNIDFFSEEFLFNEIFEMDRFIKML